jgi:hypothetical protein
VQRGYRGVAEVCCVHSIINLRDGYTETNKEFVPEVNEEKTKYLVRIQ